MREQLTRANWLALIDFAINQGKYSAAYAVLELMALAGYPADAQRERELLTQVIKDQLGATS